MALLHWLSHNNPAHFFSTFTHLHGNCIMFRIEDRLWLGHWLSCFLSLWTSAWHETVESANHVMLRDQGTLAVTLCLNPGVDSGGFYVCNKTRLFGLGTPSIKNTHILWHCPNWPKSPTHPRPIVTLSKSAKVDPYPFHEIVTFFYQ